MYKIGFRVDGQTVVLSSEESVRHAMVRGDLRRDTRVLVEENDKEVFVGVADNFRWLSNQFDELFPAPVDTAPSIIQDEPEAEIFPTEVEPLRPVEPEPEPVQIAALTSTAAVAAAAPPAPPEPPAQPELYVPQGPKPPPKSSAWPAVFIVLGVLALIGLIVGLSNSGNDYEPYAKEPTEEAAPEAKAPRYPLLDASRMYSYPETFTGNEIYEVGDLIVELSSAYVDGETAPVLRLTDPDGQVFTLKGSGRHVYAEFGVGDLDGDGKANDVILTGFTGGAHCCATINVATKTNGQWRTVDFGFWDGDGINGFPTDIGGDAAPEFRMYDNSFLYAFAPYANSYSPVQILKLRGGQMVDVSADRAYRQEHVNRMAQLEPMCRAGENGACAAYVASAARASSMSPAWSVMLQSYTNSDWSLPTGCLIKTDDACPESMQVQFASYPEALQHFLGERGFASEAYVSGPQWNGKPSFPCEGNLSEVLRLVCDTPYLRMLDHQLAVAYTRAMAFSHDRVGLQRQQQDWIRMRGNELLDVGVLTKIYQQRISELNVNIP